MGRYGQGRRKQAEASVIQQRCKKKGSSQNIISEVQKLSCLRGLPMTTNSVEAGDEDRLAGGYPTKATAVTKNREMEVDTGVRRQPHSYLIASVGIQTCVHFPLHREHVLQQRPPVQLAHRRLPAEKGTAQEAALTPLSWSVVAPGFSEDSSLGLLGDSWTSVPELRPRQPIISRLDRTWEECYMLNVG